MAWSVTTEQSGTEGPHKAHVVLVSCVCVFFFSIIFLIRNSKKKRGPFMGTHMFVGERRLPGASFTSVIFTCCW